MTDTGVIYDVTAEIDRQKEIWGEQNHPSVDPIIVGRGSQRMCEEYEIPTEVRAKFMCQEAERKGQLTWAHIAVEELSEAVSAETEEDRREELVQLAAVIVNWIDSIDRNR